MEKKDFSGMKFNRLTVIGNAPSRKEPSGGVDRRVMVKCDCGTEKDLSWRSVKRGKIKSCGCLAKELKIDIKENQKFTHWTVLKETNGYFDKKGEKTDRTFLCKCVCGKERNVNLRSLVSKQSKSCGCYGLPKKEKIKKVKIIPEDTAEEQWKESYTFPGYYISTLGKVYAYDTQIFLNQKNKNCIYIKDKQTTIIKEMYRTFYGAYDEEHIELYYDGEVRAENIKTREKNTVRKKKLEGVYRSIKMRCNDPRNKSYVVYGAKGIKIEESFNTFIKFFDWAINNGYEEGLEIDRIESDKGYCSSNCRFITKEENNLRNKNINLTIKDVHWIRSDEFSYEEALHRFTCSYNVIRNIREYRTFKNVPPPLN